MKTKNDYSALQVNRAIYSVIRSGLLTEDAKIVLRDDHTDKKFAILGIGSDIPNNAVVVTVTEVL